MLEPAQFVPEPSPPSTDGVHRQGSSLLRTLAVVATVVLIASLLVAAYVRQPDSGPVAADAIPWVASLDAGLVAARQRQQPVFVNVTADWCPPCKQMKRQTYPDAGIQTQLSQQFVSVKLDVTQGAEPYKALLQQHDVRGVPTYLIFDPQGNLLGKREGFIPPGDFSAWLNRFAAPAPAAAQPQG